MVVRKEMSVGGESEPPGGYQQTEDWAGKNVRMEAAKGESPSRGRHIRKRWVGCSGVSRRPRDTAGAPHIQIPTEQSGGLCVSVLPFPGLPPPRWQSGRKGRRAQSRGRGGSREMLLASAGLGVAPPRSPSRFGAEALDLSWRLCQAPGFPRVARSPAQSRH